MRRIRTLIVLVALACAQLAGSSSAVNAATGTAVSADSPHIDLLGKRWAPR